MSTVTKNRLQLNREGLEKNRIQLTSKEENKTYIEQTLVSLRQNCETRSIELWEKEKKLKDSLVIHENFVKEQQEKLDKALEQDLDLAPLKSKHSKLIGFKAKMEGNIERLQKDNSFFEENDTCPTCRQSIEETFKIETVSTNSKKILEIEEGLNKVAEQIGRAHV